MLPLSAHLFFKSSCLDADAVHTRHRLLLYPTDVTALILRRLSPHYPSRVLALRVAADVDTSDSLVGMRA